MRAVRFWSPAYQRDTVGSPGVWGDDWYVPLGKLAKGTYKGWVREQAISDFPTCMVEFGTILTDPVWVPAYNSKCAHTFKVK